MDRFGSYALHIAARVALSALALLTAQSPARAASPPPTAALWAPIPLLSWASGPGIFDAPHHRLILVPDDAGAPYLWMLDTRHPREWIPVPTLGTPPPGRSGRVVVFDPLRERVLIWGGLDVKSMGTGTGADLWVLDLRDTPTWSHLTTQGTPPGGRISPSAIYDPVRDRMVVFGGHSFTNGVGDTLLRDVWALSLGATPTWSPIATAGTPPTPRGEAAGIYDPVRDRLVIHGGSDALSLQGPRSDAWALTLSGTSTWTRLYQGAGGRESYRLHAAVYDPGGDRMLLIGGLDSTAFPPYPREVRALALAGAGGLTTVLGPSSGPGGLLYFAAVYDAKLDAVIVHGSDRIMNEAPGTWSLELTGVPAWHQILPSEMEPQPRFGQVQAYDARHGRTIFHGGRHTYFNFFYETEYFDDLWSLEFGDRPIWTPLDAGPVRPPTRQYATLVADNHRDRMWLFAGDITVDIDRAATNSTDAALLPRIGTPHYYDDLWRLDLVPGPLWNSITPSGSRPGPRDGHVAVLDPKRHRMLVFGGRDSLGPLNDLWALSLDDPPTWTELAPAGGPPSPRAFAVAGYDRDADRMLVYGGNDGAGGAAMTDLWALSLTGPPAWTPVATAGPAPTTLGARPGFFDATHRRLVVIGEGTNLFSDAPTTLSVLSFDDAVPTWSQVPATGAVPPDVMGRSASWDESAGRLVVLWGARGRRPEYGEDLASQITLDEVPRGTESPPHSATAAGLSLAPAGNPVRDLGRLSFSLQEAGLARLEVFDISGRRVARLLDGPRPAGPGSVIFDGRALRAGVYFVRLTSARDTRVARVVVMH